MYDLATQDSEKCNPFFFWEGGIPFSVHAKFIIRKIINANLEFFFLEQLDRVLNQTNVLELFYYL